MDKMRGPDPDPKVDKMRDPDPDPDPESKGGQIAPKTPTPTPKIEKTLPNPDPNPEVDQMRGPDPDPEVSQMTNTNLVVHLNRWKLFFFVNIKRCWDVKLENNSLSIPWRYFRVWNMIR